MSDTWQSPISQQDADRFVAEAERVYGNQCNIEEVTLQYRTDYATADFNAAAASPFEKKILQAAAAVADAAAITARTQDPILDGTSRLPGDMIICLFAVGSRYNGNVAAAAPDAINALATAIALDNSVMVCRQGALRRFEVAGDEYMSYGVGEQRYGLAADADETNVATKDRGWRKLKPIVLGKDQQLGISVFTNRLTAWPAAFTVRHMFPSLIARIK